MTAKQTIQTVDDLLQQLPKPIDGIAEAGPYNGKLKIAVKQITAKFEQYQAELARLKKDDYCGRLAVERAFEKEVMAPFRKKTCADLSAERAQVMHSPQPGQAASRFKIGALHLPPASDAAIAHNRKVASFAEEYGATSKRNNVHLEAALLDYLKDDSDYKKLALNLALESIRVSDAGFGVRHRALLNERNKITAATQTERNA